MLTRREGLRVTGAMLVFGLTIASGAAWAQESGETGAPRLALKGYDPVAYFTEGRPTLGKPQFESTWDEARYRFDSAEHLTLFEGDPDRYAPQYAGSCAMGMSKGMKIEANPEYWLISSGRLFVFSSATGPARFQANPQAMAAVADRNWERLKDAQVGAVLPQ